jgi:MFS superfamily sulfate permease-like transporter
MYTLVDVNKKESRSMKGKVVTELLASIVVFLVALPLCMGIAMASGVAPEKGILAGIIGGLIVGPIAGSPLQVSGPAAGLVVLVWQIVDQYGIEGLGLSALLAGGLQLVAGLFGGGQIFRAVSPTVIFGMLSGIGILIFGSQFHIMLDMTPSPHAVQNLSLIPQKIISYLFGGANPIPAAALVGLTTIALVLGWDKLKKGSLKLIPGGLIGIIGGSTIASLLELPVKLVKVPANILPNISSWNLESVTALLSTPDFLVATLGLAVVGSAETLLCASAVDKMHSGKRTNYNKELVAQGVGNAICGIFMALPITGVIVRSSANIEAGAKTALSAILHGAWLLAFVVIAPGLLNLIPTASLAALLVIIGWKLINLKILKDLQTKGREELLIFLLIALSIVAFNLLTGIMIGLAAAVLQLLGRLTHLDIKVTKGTAHNELNLEMEGAATFLKIPYLASILEGLPGNAILHVHLNHLTFIDHACLELLTQWGDQHEKSGGKVFLEWDALHHYVNSKGANRVPLSAAITKERIQSSQIVPVRKEEISSISKTN